MEQIEKLYSVYDNVAEEFGPVFMARNDQVAKRAVINMMHKAEVSANEYQLYQVGVFNTTNGKIIEDKKEIDFMDALGKMQIKLVEAGNE